MNPYEKYGSYGWNNTQSFNGVDADRQVFNDYLLDLGLNTRRYIDVERGKKTHASDGRHYHDELSGNYGISSGDGLVIVKIEDYEDADETGILDILPETFTVETPHGCEYRYYHTEGDVSHEIEQATGLSDLVVLQWGRVLVNGIYAVGPGSRLDASGCMKDGCDTCGLAGAGYYEVSHAPEPAITTISNDTLIQAVLAEFDSNDVDPLKFLV